MSILKTIEKARLKTLADYALVLQHLQGLNRSESCEAAKKAASEPLFVALMQRNIQLLETNEIVIF